METQHTNLIELIKQLDLADLDALIGVLNTRRYKLKEAKEKQFSDLEKIFR
jgi:hypothetical protein